jgi:hypothetical protein
LTAPHRQLDVDVDRYVAGTLDAAETEAFERHLIACAECQQAVRLGAATRSELAGLPAAAPKPLPSARRIGWQLGVLAAAAAAVLIVGLRLSDARALRRLGAVSTLPPYGGVAVRAPAGSDSVFDDAMRQYRLGRLEDARRLLLEARRLGTDSIPASFFVGVIELVRRDADAAIRELATVLRGGDSPYAAEAHYYTAKAWLLRGGADSARAHLGVAGATKAAIARDARALADSVAEVGR